MAVARLVSDLLLGLKLGEKGQTDLGQQISGLGDFFGNIGFEGVYFSAGPILAG